MASVTYLGDIRRTYGLEAYRAARASRILVNGSAARFSTKLSMESTVQFLPVCGGG